jgi:hypothetical protein
MEERDAEGRVAEDVDVDVVTYAVAASSGGLVQRAVTGSSEDRQQDDGSVVRLCVVRESAAGAARSIPSLHSVCVSDPSLLLSPATVVRAHQHKRGGRCRPSPRAPRSGLPRWSSASARPALCLPTVPALVACVMLIVTVRSRYIVAHKDQLAGKTLLELGAGTGTLHCSACMIRRRFSGTDLLLLLVVTRTRSGQG